jgi:hypothetical protein
MDLGPDDVHTPSTGAPIDGAAVTDDTWSLDDLIQKSGAARHGDVNAHQVAMQRAILERFSQLWPTGNEAALAAHAQQRNS